MGCRAATWRIFEAARAANISRIDHFVLSHFHADHASDMVALAKLMPFGHCYDRGDFIEPANQRWRDAYLSVCKDKRADEARIANLTDSADCEGHWLRAAIRPDGTFTITNGRTGYATTYAAR